jgi:hypothetical protein
VKQAVKVEITRGLRYTAVFIFLKRLNQFTMCMDAGKGQRMFSGYEDWTLDRKE